MPNITGTLTGTRIHRTNAAAVGAFSGLTHTGKSAGADGSTYCTNSELPFNASNSNSIYGNSDTVTPKSYTTVFLIKY